MNKKTIILILCVVLISSCASFLALFDDKLSLKQESFNGNQLRLNGTYFSKTEGEVPEVSYKVGTNFWNLPEYEGYTYILYNFFFFYKNGTVFYLGSLGGKSDTISNNADTILKNYIKQGFSKEKYKNVKEYWSLFQIKNDSIKFEVWSIGEVSTCHIQEGKILNDTTFVITKSYRIKDVKKRVYKKNEIYHFKAFSPKPDSTNSFIK